MQNELEAEKKKSNDESTNMWIKKYHKLEKQVDWVKKLADKLEQSNKQYSEWGITSTPAALAIFAPGDSS